MKYIPACSQGFILCTLGWVDLGGGGGGGATRGCSPPPPFPLLTTPLVYRGPDLQCWNHQQQVETRLNAGLVNSLGRPGRSRAVQSGRHVTDTWRAVPNEESLDVLSCTVHPKAGCQSVRKEDDRYRSLFTTPGTDRRETAIGTINGWAPPPVCLPSV